MPWFGCKSSSESHNVLTPPFAVITADWVSGRVVEYRDLRYQPPDPNLDWTNPCGHFPHAAIADLKVEDYKQQRDILLREYDTLLETLLSNSDFSLAWSERFSILLSRLIEPELLPYYRALGKRFFDRFLV